MRYVTKASIEGLVSKLGLREPGRFCQDWEYEVADASRVSEWMGDYLSRADLTEDERFTLMIIIVGSYDDALCEDKANSDDWSRIESALRRDCLLHQATLEYWSLPGEEDLDNVFYVTPGIRKLLAELRSEGKLPN